MAGSVRAVACLMRRGDVSLCVYTSLQREEQVTGSRILIVDDEPDLLELVRYNLVKAGYGVVMAKSGEEALVRLSTERPDLVVLDLLLPGVDGLEVCRTLKHNPQTAAVPVLMLTAKSEEADIVTGFELGADDYLTKPFSPRVLLARVKALLRGKSRQTLAEDVVITHRDLVIHPGRHEVLVQGRAITLTPMEFRILHVLARRPGWVFTRSQIVARVQEDSAMVTERTIDVHMVSLRRKLGPCGTEIETVRGVGYRFRDMIARRFSTHEADDGAHSYH